jgi:hypothetical protein
MKLFNNLLKNWNYGGNLKGFYWTCDDTYVIYIKCSFTELDPGACTLKLLRS